MNVLFLRSNPVDPDPRVEKEVKALIEEGYNVEIFAWNREEDHPIDSYYLRSNQSVVVNKIGIKATYGGGMRNNIKPLIKFQLAIIKWVTKNRKRFDVIHACDFDTALTSLILKKLYGKKLVYDIFDYYVDAFNVPNQLRNFIQRIDHFIINHADEVILCSEERIIQIKGTNPKNLSIIHNSPEDISLDLMKSSNEFDSNKLKIVYVGILSDDRLLSELMEVVKDNQNYEFHIGGFGQLEDTVKEWSIKSDNIFYYGKIQYYDVLLLESQCDVMIACYNPAIKNHKYAAPNKFYEALMLGKPIIMAKATGMSDIIEQSNFGVSIEYSKDGLIEGLGQLNGLVNNTEISIKMKQLYSDQYSWLEMKSRLKNLYLRLKR